MRTRGPGHAEMLERDARFICQVYQRDPIVMARGEGVFLFDVDGKRYFDFSAHYSSCCLGHAHPGLNKAIADQLASLVSLSAQFASRERIACAEKLLEAAGGGFAKVLFGCTGSDANESALKIAKTCGGGGTIVSFWRGFHGSTAGSAAATGKAETIQYHPRIAELLPSGFIHVAPPYCYRCDYGKSYPACGLFCLEFIRRRLAHDGVPGVAAFIIEPVQAAGGVIVPPPGFMAQLAKLCRDLGALLIFDEVVTGIGRTGSMFAWMQAGVRPDLLVIGKALTGGYIPGSAVLMDGEIARKMEGAILHGHTHSAYPLMCAAALATLRIVAEQGLCESSKRVGDRLLSRLRQAAARTPHIGDVRGQGLLIGIELVTDKETKEPGYEYAARLQRRLLEAGIVTELESSRRLGSSVIVLHPPLILTEKQADEAMDIFESVLAEADRDAATAG